MKKIKAESTFPTPLKKQAQAPPALPAPKAPGLSPAEQTAKDEREKHTSTLNRRSVKVLQDLDRAAAERKQQRALSLASRDTSYQALRESTDSARARLAASQGTT